MRKSPARVFLKSLFSRACLPWLLWCGGLSAQDLAEPVKEGAEAVTKLMKLWPTLSKSGSAEQREQRPAGEVFGRSALKTVGGLSGGKFSRLDMLLISNGIGLIGPAFEEEYVKISQELPVAYAERFGTAGEPQPAPAGAAAGTKTLYWAAGDIGISLIFEPTKRVRISLRPLNEKEKAAGVERLIQARAAKWKEQHVVSRPNDDVIIENLPAVEVAQEGRDATPRTVQMLQKYYAWKVDVDAFLKRLEGATGDESTDVIIMRELAAEAGVKLRVFEGFDSLEVTRAIDSGNLVIILRASDAARLTFHRDFAIKQSKNPDLELPPVSDEERKKWPTMEDAPYSNIGVIRGYNTRRGEIIVGQPGWHTSYQHLRIRPEELKVSAQTTMIFSLLP